ncbi:MAG: hypothetical protein COY10_00665 [Candidatus Portnoybacteria bacterium CG_4_10_14_0_2_um_filter_43_36]|uniref:Uncharacterized protein n=3 Tax=Candidatus Portnoyibacteriota TaxID=1817913 RepID=A0A2M7YKN4_9BACT|nr:MAG: hypothetical protein COY10_00665 [Candidatus Portnoybacteria bacterium CG_4_10_14_0_2_um_filter_43_36]PJA63539.1 MAG: hypothetical protein CO160_02930 [Candidatus Portnoybacteria bacterium CG_4_9_14_3_um_filter_43_11]
MKYLIPLILIFSFGGQIVLASGITPLKNPEQLEKFYQKIQNSVINPMKQIPEKVKSAAENLMEILQNKAESKKEEIKQEIKQEIKSETKEQIESQKKSWEGRIKTWLTPLKIKIQEGREILRRWLGKVREAIF